MIPIIGITGRSGSGKTRLAERLISELVGRGHRVAAIKHTRHQVEIDKPGKDSDRFFKAGAHPVSLASPSTVAMYTPTEEGWTPEDIVSRLFPEVDLVLVEGYGDAAIPKIGLLRKGFAEELPTQKGLIAVVADMDSGLKIPAYLPDQVTEIADLVEGYILRQRKKRDVRLFVNGRPIQIKPFIKDFFLKTVTAMVESLKGTEGPTRIQLTIDHPAESEPADE